MKTTQLILNSFLFVFLLSMVSCGDTPKNETPTDTTDIKDEEYRQMSQQLAQEYIIVDGHVDLPYRLTVQNFKLDREYLGIPVETDDGDFDYKRAKKGGLDAPFMSIYIPSDHQKTKTAKSFADGLIDMVTAIADSIPDKFTIVSTPKEVESTVKAGKIALPMGMENGAPIEDDLANVQYFRDRGISYVTLTHSKNNQICDSSYDTTRLWNGLSDFGRDVVAEMNRVGIMVDISHVSDSTFYQVMKVTKAPVIASHSSARKFVPDFERNMSDDMIAKMGENDGVIMINFGSTFVDGDSRDSYSALGDSLKQILVEKGLKADDSLALVIEKQFEKDNPILFADVERVADHIDLVVKLAGVEHVGFGSDYDGVGNTLPTGLKDVSDYPNLLYTLLKRGYSKEDIEKICYGNIFRVWNKVLEVSEEIKKSES
ncbi:MAG: dipeptidase [Chitinophagales bacterium]